MRTARPLGLSPDGRSLIVVVDGGEQLAIPADERLRAALRNDRARIGQLEIDMESALRPRDIQARIRAGESLEAVAQAAGVPSEQIEPYAAPVIAEREHIAGLAQTNPLRRAGDAVAHRSLRSVVSDRLLSRGVDIDTVDWDAWRSGERRWTVRLSYESGSAERQADFTYDQTGRFSTAANDDARWLTGEQSSSHGPQPGRRRRGSDPDNESTIDLNDELAIVRAIQPQFEVTPDIDDDDAEVAESDGSGDSEDAFAEGDLEEVNGVYDIVPGDRSSLDVLYDMLSSFDEDSVQIYAGLVRPNPEQTATPALDDGPDGAAEDEGEPTERLEDEDSERDDAEDVEDPEGPEDVEDLETERRASLPDPGTIAETDLQGDQSSQRAVVEDDTPRSGRVEAPAGAAEPDGAELDQPDVDGTAGGRGVAEDQSASTPVESTPRSTPSRTRASRTRSTQPKPAKPPTEPAPPAEAPAGI